VIVNLNRSRVAHDAPVPEVVVDLTNEMTLADVVNGGVFRITGTTKNTATPVPVPVSRRVRLHVQDSGRLLRQVWSDPVTGAYAFEGLRANKYFVLAFDHTGLYGGEVETDVTPEATP